MSGASPGIWRSRHDHREGAAMWFRRGRRIPTVRIVSGSGTTAAPGSVGSRGDPAEAAR